MQVPTEKESKLFTFMHPFGRETWALVSVALIVVSVSLMLVARVSPYECPKPRPPLLRPGLEPETQPRRPPRLWPPLSRRLTLSNCVWFIFGVLLRQGSGVSPQVLHREIATRDSPSTLLSYCFENPECYSGSLGKNSGRGNRTYGVHKQTLEKKKTHWI